MATLKMVYGPRGGNRHYELPDGTQLPSVTNVLGVIGKPALTRWAANSVAKFAVESKEDWLHLDDTAAWNLLKGVPFSQAEASANTGTDAHTHAENRMLGLPSVANNNATRNVDAILHDLETSRDFEILHVECTVANKAIGYAGSFDLIARWNGEVTLFDWKTSKAVYPDNGIQLAAYRYAEGFYDHDGKYHSLIQPDGKPWITKTAILWVPKEGPGKIVEMKATEDEFAVMVAAKRIWKWQQDSK